MAGDGGSSTPDAADFRRSAQSQGKDYEWFKREKDDILAKYDTVYGNGDYNEFITNGWPSSAVRGVIKYTVQNGNHDARGPNEYELCRFFEWNANGNNESKWPVYTYDRKSFKLERHLDCSDANLKQFITPAPT